MSAFLFESRASIFFRHSDFVILQSPFALYRSRSLSSRAHHIPKCHGLIVPSWFRLQEKAVKAAKVRPEPPAIYRRNKFESYIPDIFAFQYLGRNFWRLCFFVPVGPSPPPQKAMTPATRLLFSGGDN